MAAHLGLSPEDVVMRMCATAVWGIRMTRRMNTYFFKLTREYASDLVLKCVYGNPYALARPAIGK
jgi:hypothetical protein